MKHKAFYLSGFLLLITAILVGYRVIYLHYPLFPSAKVKAWRIVTELYFQPDSIGIPVLVRIALPQNRPDQSLIDERFISGDMEIDLVTEREGRFGQWSGVLAKKEEYVGYEATVVIRQRPGEAAPQSPPATPLPGSLSASEQGMLNYLAANLLPRPIEQKLRAVAGIARGQWGGTPPTNDKLVEWTAFRKKFGPPRSLMYLSQAAGLPARVSTGLILQEGVVSTPAQWLEIWTGKGWEGLEAETGNPYPGDEKLLVLTSGGLPVANVGGGQLRDVHWTLSRQVVSPWRMHLEPALHAKYFLNRWSLFSLPPGFQDTFRIIL
ncbi:MAG: UUP1 family membrane protein, partial [Syntrophales bacterium]